MLKFWMKILGWAQIVAGCGTMFWAVLGVVEGRVTVSGRWTKPLEIDRGSSLLTFLATESILLVFSGFFIWCGWTLLRAKINQDGAENK